MQTLSEETLDRLAAISSYFTLVHTLNHKLKGIPDLCVDIFYDRILDIAESNTEWHIYNAYITLNHRGYHRGIIAYDLNTDKLIMDRTRIIILDENHELTAEFLKEFEL
jgi:hypothetical protein